MARCELLVRVASNSVDSQLATHNRHSRPCPTPQVLTTIRRATELMRATPGRSGGIIAPERADEIMVVGDLHGNFPAFKKVLALAALDRHPGRHLVLQELIHGKLMYPDDKGDRSHQLLDVFAALNASIPIGST